MTEQQQMVMILGKYAAGYTDCKLDARGLSMYVEALQGIPLPAIEAAMKKLVRTCRFFPKVAEIILAAEDFMEYLSEQNGGSHTPTAAEAWGEVQSLAKHVPPGREWKYSHPFVQAAAERFGIYELRTLPMDGVNTARAQFMRMYDSIKSRGKEQATNRAVLKQLGQPKIMELCQSLGLKLALPE